MGRMEDRNNTAAFRGLVIGTALVVMCPVLPCGPVVARAQGFHALSPESRPLAALLKSDGTVNFRDRYRGSLDARGWRLSSGAGEPPHFAQLAAGDEGWDSRFGSPDMSDFVEALAVDGRGNLFVGGSFATAGGLTVNYVARWDGSSWSTLGGGVDGWVRALVLDGDGNLYAGGFFHTAGGTPANHIAKWDGSKWSALGAGTDKEVYALVIDGSGNLYAGGAFGTAGGAVAPHVARWDGSNWSPLGSGMNWRVCALAVDGSGNLYAGGLFGTAGGVPANRIAKWDGLNWSALGSGMENDVNALVAGQDGEIYAGGKFQTAGGVPVNYVARWDGAAWSALGNGVDGTSAPGVDALARDGSGNLYVGGYFSTAGGGSAAGIARWDGSSWTALGSGVDEGVLALACYGSGGLYAGGWFWAAGGLSSRYIARWDGASWSALGHGLSDYVKALVLDGAGNLYVGGSFHNAGGIPVNHVARWDGSSWSPLGSGMNDTVHSLTLDGDGNLYAGGAFTQAGGTAANRIAKWDGSSWSAMGVGLSGGTTTVVHALVSDGSGNLYAGGYFTTAGGVSARNVARWNGSSWSALGTGTDGAVNALAYRGSTLYAGGYFTRAGGVTVNHVARWNGSSWGALGSGMDLSGDVLDLVLDGNGNLYAGGSFNTAGGISALGIAQWNGSSWQPVGGGSEDYAVSALAMDGSGRLYAGGPVVMGGVTVNSLARWDGSSWSALGSGLDGTSTALAIDGSGNVYAGGSFHTAGGKPSWYLGLWHKPADPSFIIDAAAGPNGSISPSGQVSVLQGADQTFRISPDPGYYVADVLVEGNSVGAVAEYSFNNVTAPHTIFAAFAPLVSTAKDGEGTMSVSPASATYGSAGNNFTFTFTPNIGDFGLGSRVALTIPAGWTPPGTGAGPGQVTVASGTCSLSGTPPLSVAGATVVVDVASCKAGQSFTVTYAGVTVPVVAGSPYTFAAQADIGPGGAGLVAITAGSPTVTVTPAALTVAGITADNKTYDGTTAATLAFGSAALVGVIGADAVALDTSGATAHFSDRNAGAAKPVAISGLVLGGTDAGNYAVTQPSGAADIARKPVTVTAVTDIKPYDGTVGSRGVPTLSAGTPLAAGDTEPVWTQAFDTPDAGTGKTVTPAGLVGDGNGGLNYACTFVPDTTGVITPRAVTVTADPKTKAVGSADPALTYAVDPALLGVDYFGGALTRAPGEAPGRYAITQGTLTAGGNYAITYVGSTLTITPAISGATGIGGVRLRYDDGGPRTVVSGADGSYVLIVSYGWSGTVTPSLSGFTFAPPSIAYTNVTASLAGQDYVARRIPATFASVGRYDGWVLESSEPSNRGGSVNAADATFRLGDDALNRQYRAILSFDTSRLPDRAVVTRVRLGISKQGAAGTDPFRTHGSILVDIRKGAFGAKPTLQTVDFQATAGRSNVGSIKNAPVGRWYGAVLPRAAAFINTSGVTQLRLRFARDDNNDRGADYLRFFSGNAPATRRPVLVVEYQVPSGG